jgi:hypothetical protein
LVLVLLQGQQQKPDDDDEVMSDSGDEGDGHCCSSILLLLVLPPTSAIPAQCPAAGAATAGSACSCANASIILCVGAMLACDDAAACLSVFERGNKK